MTDINTIYRDLAFPEPPAARPYTFINMVATIDGKTISDRRGKDVKDLGGNADHILMRRVEDQADSVMMGATTLRATDPKWDPKTNFRVVVSSRGEFDYSIPFFQSGGQSFVACPADKGVDVSNGVGTLAFGNGRTDVKRVLSQLAKMGAKKLLCFGGSELNAQLLSQDLVDELFLTIAPKVKLGKDVPTYAGGEPLDKDNLLQFTLLESHTVGDEVFLRYRRKH